MCEKDELQCDNAVSIQMNYSHTHSHFSVQSVRSLKNFCSPRQFDIKEIMNVCYLLLSDEK